MGGHRVRRIQAVGSSKKSDRQSSPEAADAMNRERRQRVVDVQKLHQLFGEFPKEEGYSADGERPKWRVQMAAGRRTHQPRENATAKTCAEHSIKYSRAMIIANR